MKNLLRISSFKKSSIELFEKVILSVVLSLVIELVRVQAQTVSDIDGNVYNTVTIGTQVWMKENLKTTKYNDNTSIPLVTDNTEWYALNTPGYCWYNNDAATYKATYGALYRWYTVNTGKLCPLGWHVPTDEEWTILTTYLGGESLAGGKLKEQGTIHWLSPNTGATNESGFTALPGGKRNIEGTYTYISEYGFWWCSTEYPNIINSGWSRIISTIFSNVTRSAPDKRYGYSVRCMEGLATDIENPSASKIEVYPNPVSGILNIDYKGENFETFNILNSQGAYLAKEKAITPGQQFDFSKYMPGLYFLEFVKPSGEIKRVKVINR